MGCFPACFTSSNRRRHRNSVAVAPSIQPQHHILETTEEAVRFEPAKPDDTVKYNTDSNLPREVSEEETKNEAENNVTVELVEIPKETEPILGSIGSSVVPAHALCYRYENCSNSEDEDEGLIDLSGSDLNGDDYDHGSVDDEVERIKQIVIQEQESSESLFSISIGSRKRVSDGEEDEKEVNSQMPKAKAIESDQSGNRTQHCESVLRPIENLSQWKEAKAKAVPLYSQQQEKENVNAEQDFDIPISPEPTLKMLKQKPLESNDLKLMEQETGVDTSLSSWLVECESTPKPNGSENSVGNLMCEGVSLSRPVLGAWTSEELKQLSIASTPNQSPSLSSDQISIKGTVGSYWSHTGRATDSDSNSSKENAAGRSREAEIVKWKTTPLEAKLERVLDLGILGA